MLNKVNENINNLYKQIIEKENDFDTKLDKLNKLNDNIKKILLKKIIFYFILLKKIMKKLI